MMRMDGRQCSELPKARLAAGLRSSTDPEGWSRTSIFPVDGRLLFQLSYLGVVLRGVPTQRTLDPKMAKRDMST